MQEQQPIRRLPVAAIASISTAVLAAGGVGLWWALKTSPTSTTPPVTLTPQPNVPTQLAQPGTEQQVDIYWLKDTGKNIAVVPSKVSVKAADKPNEVLEAAFNHLLAEKPGDPDFVSTIPKGTKVRSVKVQDDGVHVNLSPEFTTGGGSTSMSGRLGQVLYTATSLNPNAQVWIEVEGKKLEVLGGEGIELDQPLTRKEFERNFQL